MLIIDKLSKSFGSRTILNALSLKVDHGKIAVLLGGSGVGKSTLLRILNNLEESDSGTITLDGKEVSAESLQKNHLVGMVFQNFNLFDHLTIKENITLSLTHVLKKTAKEADAKAMKLLSEYNLSDKADKYPASLSGGQKQRIAIMRAIALEPKIICFDEPTSALDPLLTNYVGSMIQKLAHEGYIIIIATHDISLLDKIDATLYLMNQGAIIEKASSLEIKNNRNLFPRLHAFIEGIEHSEPTS